MLEEGATDILIKLNAIAWMLRIPIGLMRKLLTRDRNSKKHLSPTK
jgi:hypothetical protein